MAIEVKIVDPLAKFDEAVPLLEANWRESGSPIEFIAEDTRTFYRNVQRVGALFAAGAYDGADLIGYCIITIIPHPVNHSVIICNADGVYLKPDYRKGRTLALLMEAVRLVARKHSCFSISWHAQSGSDFATVLAERIPPLSNYFWEALSYE